MPIEPKNGKLLWHLTALENIESIFVNGLQSRKSLNETTFTDIADQDILDSRAKFNLEHYIPFHFYQKTPFAGKVMVDNPEKEFVYLTLKRDLAEEKDFKVITKHPLCDDAEICDYIDGMGKIEWSLMEGDRNYAIHNIRETCMAECIGPYQSIQINAFHNIYTNSQKAYDYINELKKEYGVRIYVDFDSRFFV